MEGPAHDSGALVVGQNPPGGANLPEDRIVHLWLAAERRFIEVPPVIGELVGETERIIAERGLRPEVVDGAAPADTRVRHQEPEPGARIGPDHPVRVWLEDWVAVPDLVGLAIRQADRELGAHGLRMEFAREHLGQDDAIIFQEPEAGARVAPGSIIVVDVPRSAALVRVPSVIELQREAAFLEIERARLVPRLSPTNDHDQGRVIRQRPVGGVRARAGDPVLLWFFAHPRTQCGWGCVALIVLVSITVVGLGTWLWLRGSARADPSRRNDERGPAGMAFEAHIGELRTRLEGPLETGTEIRLEPVPDIDDHQALDARRARDRLGGTAETTLNDVFPDKRGTAMPAVYSALEDRAAIKARTEDVRRSGIGLPASTLLKRALDRLDALLDIDLKTILVGDWSHAREIRDYGERSRREPTKEFLVSLAKHVVRSQHRPYLEIVINGNHDGRITFDVDAKLKLEGFQLVIRDGVILAVTTGTCEGSGEARLEGITIVEQTGCRIQLPGRLDLGDGIVIA